MGDLLTSYDGVAITYDAIGNPDAIGGWAFTWEHGRQLASMSNGTTTWTNTYNADGLRIERTSGSKTYSYIYTGSTLTQMTVGADTLYFTYDASGIPLTVTHNGTTYYYATNLQGDITAILDANGTAVVAYTYDAWGNPLSTTGTMATTLGAVNPLRYRGYVYDAETELYYLQSRYYNPEVGRFINADAFAATGQGLTGNNMFAYCGNNPVCFSDPAGTFFLYDWWNAAEDTIWKIGAKVLKNMGYNLTGELLELSASGSGNTYTADRNSPIAKEIASNKDFTNSVIKAYNSGVNSQSEKLSYEFPVSQGDVGAALHWVSYTFKPIADGQTGKQYLLVSITDTFDFTEMKNPFAQESFKAGFLWLANDIACIDMNWGLLDPVSVKIEVVIPIKS